MKLSKVILSGLLCAVIIASVTVTSAKEGEPSKESREINSLVTENWSTHEIGPMPDSRAGQPGVITWTVGPRLQPLMLKAATREMLATHIDGSNQTRPWGVVLQRQGHTLDLSGAEARISWEGAAKGDRAVHVLLMSPQDWWYVSQAPIKFSSRWGTQSSAISQLKWRRYNVITGEAMSGDSKPDLKKVIQAGLADLKGDSSADSSVRIASISIHGQLRKIEKKAVPAEKPVVARKRAAAILPEGVVAHKEIVYAHYGEREMRLDLYVPKGKGPFPAIVFIHGGGWYKGDPSSYTPMAMKMASYGYVTANIRYRLIGEAPFPANINDCKAAVRWLRAHTKEYSVDADFIGSVGGSAGGHLSGLLGTSGNVKKLEGNGGNPGYSSALQACCVMAGTMDLTDPATLQKAQDDPRRRIINHMGGTWEEAKQNYIDASPITHVNSRTPPMLFMDGEFDNPRVRYVAICEKLDALGIPWRQVVIKDGPHPFWTSHPFFDPAVVEMKTFFDRYLKQGQK